MHKHLTLLQSVCPYIYTCLVLGTDHVLLSLVVWYNQRMYTLVSPVMIYIQQMKHWNVTTEKVCEILTSFKLHDEYSDYE